MANRPENLRPWKPGQAPYAEWLKTLTPEQKEAHLRQRRERKAMRQAMAEVVTEYQNRWIAEMHNAAWAQLVKARDSGDTAAFVAVWDRIIGRPQDADRAAADGQALPWSDRDI